MKNRATTFYVLFFLFLLAFTITSTFYDYDLWARLIVGKYFIQTGHVIKMDFLSYTPTHVWFDHEWGSGVIFYLVQHFFSTNGILLLQVILTFLIFVVIIKVINLRGVKTTSAYNFLFFYSALLALKYLYSNPVRCQMFSFVLFALFIYILELSRKGENRPLWAIPFIMIIWNNLHGGCVAGIGLIGIYLVGEILNRKPFKKYFYTLVAAVAVLPINPWGFSYIEFLFKASTMPRVNIVEWWSPFGFYYKHSFMETKYFLLILILFELDVFIKGLIARDFKFDMTKFLVLASTLFMAIKHTKLMPFAVISFACFTYDDFYTIFNYLTKNIFEKIAMVKESIIYFLVLVFALGNINVNLFIPLLGTKNYPVREIEFIRLNNIKGNLFTNFGIGSYASYKLYPHNKIFMDGRYEEVYYDYMLPWMDQFYYMKGNYWTQVLTIFPPDVLLIENTYPVFNFLNSDSSWKMVFEGPDFGVFVPAKNARNDYKMPSIDPKHYESTVFDTDIDFRKKSENAKKP